MMFIDSHTHIDFNEFKDDREIIIRNAIDIGISDIIVSATIAKNWPKINDLCQTYSHICHATYGLHPMFMHDHDLDSSDNHLTQLDTFLGHHRAVAVSEIGLDYFIKEADSNQRKQQEELFVSQCEIALSHNLPVIIHARKSLDIVLKHLRRLKGLRGSIHSFSGSEQQAKQLIDLGYYLSFGGPITYDRATKLHKLVKNTPLNSLLIETDSPDQPDSIHYGKRNEPAFIVNVAKKVAELKNQDIELIAEQTSKNAIELFNLRTV